jgi:NADPH-dependent 2,4-dienoyl-CoA reductase/sulfur reductase-like enzyme
VSETYDYIVIGAGPAGMAAAATAARLGVATLLIDEQPAPGGQIYRGVEGAQRSASAVSAADWARGAALAAEFRASGAHYRPGTQVWQLEADARVYVTDGTAARRLRARRVLLATGAMERPMPLPGWTLPGVMTVGGAQILYKSSGWLPPPGTWIAGSGALLWLYAAQALEAGARIAGLLDTTPSRNYLRALRYATGALRHSEDLERGLELKRRVRAAGVRIVNDVTEVEAKGDGQLTGIRFCARGQWQQHAAAMLLLHQGVVPNAHATRSLGAAHRWLPLQRCLAPVVDAWGNLSAEGYAAAGDCAGIVGAQAAALQGRLAALDTARALGAIDTAQRDREAAPLRRALAQQVAARPFIDRLFLPRENFLAPADEVLVCRCESVSARQVRAAVRLGCVGPNQMKAYTRCGMGPCQGRMCGSTATEIIAHERGLEPEAVGAFNVRAPLKPLTVSEWAALDETRAVNA